ncbi:MAG: hypothetical protein BGO12_03300 [Verrucomicrobia bacterium 61-8]|nr:sugar phosphate isomerase/epimerase [Verrucomicrobiota bacterium]OJV22844.1 MAG: hypothetical protein BGO12_03300 [Verrucomicrobia bacterium 61-8]
MKFGFSTLGAPQYSLAQCNELAVSHGLDFLEVRTLGGSLDMPAYFAENPVPAGALPIRVLGSSLFLTTAGDADVEAFFGFMKLAAQLGTPYLRVFGGGDFSEDLDPEKLRHAASIVRRIREKAAAEGWTAEPILEMHDAFSNSERCQRLNALLDEPLPLLWDSHHTWRIGGESLADTWQAVSPLIRHVHYKDSRATEAGFDYVLPGEGEFPSHDLFSLLKEQGYAGGVSLEWERKWHPELSPLEEAMPGFIAVLREAGFTPHA